jgi:hypothetical protein
MTTSISKTSLLALITVTTLSIAPELLAASPTGTAPKGCDLSIKPRIVSRKDARTVATLEGEAFGERIYTGDALFALTTTSYLPAGLTSTSEAEECRIFRDSAHSNMRECQFNPFDKLDNDDKNEVAISKATTELRQECNDTIRDEFKSDIVSDDGHEVLAKHYACSAVYAKKLITGYRLMIDIIKGEPMYEIQTLDQIQKRKM